MGRGDTPASCLSQWKGGRPTAVNPNKGFWGGIEALDPFYVVVAKAESTQDLHQVIPTHAIKRFLCVEGKPHSVSSEPDL